MSTGRVIWIVWSLAWAAFWVFFLVIFPLNFVLAAGAVAAIFLPIGKTTIPQIRYDANYRPPPISPSSVFDPRYKDQGRGQP